MKFYNDTVEIVYDEKKHKYARLVDGKKVIIPSVTTILKVLNKPALVPWAAKMVAEKMLRIMPREEVKDCGLFAGPVLWESFEKIVMEAKSAPRDILVDAADVGKEAHKIIETMINASFQALLATDIGIVNVKDGWQKQIKDSRVVNCVTAALDWMKLHKVVWQSTESVVYSKIYDYAGIIDGRALVSSCEDKTCCPETEKDVPSLIDWKSSNGFYAEYFLQTAAYQFAHEEENDQQLIADRWILRLGKEDGEFEPWRAGPREFMPDFTAFEKCLELSRAFKLIEDRVAETKKKLKKIAAKDWLDLEE